MFNVEVGDVMYFDRKNEEKINNSVLEGLHELTDLEMEVLKSWQAGKGQIENAIQSTCTIQFFFI